MSASAILFDEIFEVRKMEDKKFDRVSRFVCESEDHNMSMIIDINTEIYPVSEGQHLKMVIANTLNIDGTPAQDEFDATLLDGSRKTLMDEYDYVVHGRVFKYNQPKEGADGKRDNKIEILASFGGLIMSLKGDPRNIKLINNDQKIYLLMRKVNA